MKKIKTARFGELEIQEDRIFHFADGLPAFEDEREFVILPFDDDSPYSFLQSVATPELAFLMTVPFVFFPDYEFVLEDDVMDALAIKGSEDMQIYTLVTIPGGNIKEMTANLMAPVVINKKTREAKQVVLDKSQYTTKHRLFPPKGEK
ncbi:MAG: flagellar assembly protein FliW [Negativicutes bacterium]